MHKMTTSRLNCRFPALAVAALSLSAATALAQEKYRMLQDDFPFQGACINANFPSNNIALKGLAIHVGNGANVLFDTDLCRMAAGWTGGFITDARRRL
jgi:hypothetical protein